MSKSPRVSFRERKCNELRSCGLSVLCSIKKNPSCTFNLSNQLNTESSESYVLVACLLALQETASASIVAQAISSTRARHGLFHTRDRGTGNHRYRQCIITSSSRDSRSARTSLLQPVRRKRLPYFFLGLPPDRFTSLNPSFISQSTTISTWSPCTSSVLPSITRPPTDSFDLIRLRTSCASPQT